ncbi:MAG: AAA family ATPase [Anaerolineae bacterium]|nr:AAA family ATPase [Anaerolineae bacterium]
MEAILFIGIPASGKSTFYKERFFTTHVRINLDLLNTRKREALILQACLAAKQPFAVDNTNVLKTERAPYIEQARAAGFRVVGYYFQSRLQDALDRNRQRTGKAYIPEKGLIARYSQMQVPNLDEGFEQLFYVLIDPESGEFLVKEWNNEI